MTDRADEGPPSTATLVDEVNAAAAPDGVDGGYLDVLVAGDLVDPHGSLSVDASQDPGPVGGGWRSDITGKLLGAVGMGLEWAVGIEQRLSEEIFGKMAWGPHAAMRVSDWTIPSQGRLRRLLVRRHPAPPPLSEEGPPRANEGRSSHSGRWT
jgi:hypothetical protein